jgi:hypothetical protein
MDIGVGGYMALDIDIMDIIHRLLPIDGPFMVVGFNE